MKNEDGTGSPKASEATNPTNVPPTSSSGRSRNLKNTSGKELAEIILSEIEDVKREIHNIQESQENLDWRMKELEKSVRNNSKATNKAVREVGKSKFKVVDSDGNPTEEAYQVLIDVIKQGVEGLETEYFRKKFGYDSRTTANNKKKDMAQKAFPDVLKIHKNPQKVGASDRLLHRDIKRKSKKELLEEVRNEYSLLKDDGKLEEKECPGCGAMIATRVLEKKDWECVKCGTEIDH